jgi:hypothetical protein
VPWLIAKLKIPVWYADFFNCSNILFLKSSEVKVDGNLKDGYLEAASTGICLISVEFIFTSVLDISVTSLFYALENGKMQSDIFS